MNYNPINVLLIEDNPGDIFLIHEMLDEIQNSRFKLHNVQCLDEGLDYLQKNRADIILLDLNLPDSSGLDTFYETKNKAPMIPIVILSSLDDENTAVRAVKGDAQDYLIKGKVDSSLLARSMFYAIERKSIEEELIKHRNHLEELVEERTVELQAANEFLQREIEERELAEEALKENQKLLKKSLDEKEMLLKEIHHRVKNNLMVISSLLSLQSRYIKDKKTLDIFRESQNRAKSMALIHEKLYNSMDLKRINFGEYIRTLTKDLFRTYMSDSGHVRLDMDVEDIMLDINTAVPIGLIVNELVSNSMKHAFPAVYDHGPANEVMGEINVNFKSDGDDFILTVKDNGIGFPEELDFKNTDTLGLRLVNSLTDQIHGKIQLKVDNGTEFKITFKEMEYKNK